MRMTFRQGMVITTAIIGLSTMTAIAAPPGAKDPVMPPAAANGPATPATTPPRAGDQANQAAPGSQQSMETTVEQRIEELHTKLQITPAQEPEWKKFAETMRDNAHKMDQAFDNRVQQLQNMNAVANMRSYVQIAREHAQDVQALMPRLEALYSKMSQSQKQATDEVFREDANGGQASEQHG